MYGICPVCTRRFIVIVLHLVVTINVMFATIHSLQYTESSPYIICTNQEDSIISDWGGAGYALEAITCMVYLQFAHAF